jgi:outer membrane protein W
MAGGSYYLNKFSLASEIVGSWDDIGLTITEKCKNSLAFFGGAGLDFFIANNIALTGDIKYVISTAKGTWSLADQVTDTSVSGDIESIKLGAFVIKAGIRFLF